MGNEMDDMCLVLMRKVVVVRHDRVVVVVEV